MSDRFISAKKYRIKLIHSQIAPHSTSAHSKRTMTRDIVNKLSAEFEPSQIWLMLYIINASLPTSSSLQENLHAITELGIERWLKHLLKGKLHNRKLRFLFVHEKFLVDVHHTANTHFATGIQRVTRETVRRWVQAEHPGLLLITWGGKHEYFRPISQQTRMFFDEVSGDEATSKGPPVALVPLGGQYLQIELNTEEERASRVTAFIDATATSLTAIVYDCVPLSTAETTFDAMHSGFHEYLRVLERAQRLAPISEAAAVEFSGWKRMINAYGIDGPDIAPIDLAADIEVPSDAELNRFSKKFDLDPKLPIITCVGSHEPRKNHLAVLRVAEKLWSEGRKFQILFIGGNAWNSEYYNIRVRALEESGQKVSSYRQLTDVEIYSALRLSRFSVFPSLNEGFGLPVAESLLLGTPVITSNYGSTRHIAFGQGALLIDPRDDLDLHDAMKLLLQDDSTFLALKDKANSFKWKSWDTYAAETWKYLTSAEPSNRR